MSKTRILRRSACSLTVFCLLPTANAQETNVQEQAISDLGTIYISTGSTDGLGYAPSNVGFGGVETPVLRFPRSVSVVTSDELRNRGVHDVYPAIEMSNGVTLAMQDDLGERSTVIVRGFEGTSIQVDGSPSSGSKNLNLFDTAIYDRIEILRGPSGVMQGAREPGATVNLVHKRPGTSPELHTETEVGSWKQRRAVLDWGGPISNDGRLRGRGVLAASAADSFVDVVNHNRRLGYGVLEYDLTDQTTMAIGATLQKGTETGSRGLPAWQGGPLLDVSRDTYAGPDWAYTDLSAKEIFTEILHDFDNGVVFTLKGSLQDRQRNGKLAFADSPVDRETGMTTLIPEWRIDREKAAQVTAGIEVPFTFWERQNRFLLLADYQRVNFQYDRARADEIPFDIFHPNYSMPEPHFTFDRFDKEIRKEHGLTAQLELHPAQSWTVLGGARVGWYDMTATNRKTGAVRAQQTVAGKVVPYLAAMYELGDGASLYGSYSTSFVPQTNEKSDGTYVAPRKGHQYEVGYKKEIMPDALLQVAAFQIIDDNRAVEDLNDPTGDYYVGSGKVRSRGIEAEIAGRITDNLDVSVGYTYLVSSVISDPVSEGASFEPRAPRNSLKAWGKYTFTEGTFDGWSLAGGISAYSKRSRTADDVTLTQGGYYTADLQVGYQIRENNTITMTVTNLFDKIYYHSVGLSERQNYYGAPRAFTVNLTSRF